MKRSAPATTLVGLLALAAVLAPLSGCGSNGGALTNASSASTRQAKDQVTFTVTWPARPSSAAGKVIPVAANAIVLNLQGQSNTPGQKSYSQTLTRPTGGSLTSTATFTNVELGGYIATATAYPTPAGPSGGNAQAIGSTASAINVVAGSNPAIAITMFATVKTIAITPQVFFLSIGSTLQLIATAFDANGAQVITTGAITWTSSKPTIESVGSTTGLVTGLSTGTSTITAQYIDGTTPVGTQGTGASASIIINTVPVGLSTTASWAKFHGDAQNTGQAGALVTGNATLGSAVAAFKSGNEIDLSAPAVAGDGTMYIGSWDDNVYALKRTGSVLTKSWSFKTGSVIESSPAISASGIVYAGSYDGNVYAFTTTPANPSNVTPIWTFQTPGIVHGSPAIAADGTVYVGSSTGSDPTVANAATRTDNSVYALDGLTGAQKWVFPVPTVGGVQTAPALSKDGTIVYVGDLDGNVYALNASTGTLLWSHATGGQVYSSSPAVAIIGGVSAVFIGANNTSGGPNMFALNAITGSEIWHAFIPGNVFASPAISTDASGNALKLYIASFDVSLANNNAVFQLNPATGSTNWQYPAAGTSTPIGPVASSPVIGKNGAVYFGSDDGNVYSVLSTGVSQWATPVQVGNPLVDASSLLAVESTPGLGTDGTVYIGCYDGKVVAIQ